MPSPQNALVFSQLGPKWTATIATPSGPVTAVGDTMSDARAELNTLLALRGALANTMKRRP